MSQTTVKYWVKSNTYVFLICRGGVEHIFDGAFNNEPETRKTTVFDPFHFVQ